MKKLIVMLTLVAAPFMASAQSVYTLSVADSNILQTKDLRRGSYDFGMLWVGQYSYTDFILGARNFPVRVNSIDVYGRFFEGATNCPIILNPGQQCVIRVTYAPRIAGDHFGQLNLWVENDRTTIDLYGRARR